MQFIFIFFSSSVGEKKENCWQMLKNIPFALHKLNENFYSRIWMQMHYRILFGKHACTVCNLNANWLKWSHCQGKEKRSLLCNTKCSPLRRYKCAIHISILQVKLFRWKSYWMHTVQWTWISIKCRKRASLLMHFSNCL